jgi:transposase InsO family protein
LRIYKNQTDVSSTDFLRRLRKVAPMKIQKILTDNGSQFTDRFTAKDKRATGKHAFDVRCAEMGIVHRLSPPRHP